MEFRHARRRKPRRRKLDFSPALVVICVVFLTVVYGVGASKFGTWLASSVVAPAICELAPVSTPTAAAARTPAERTAGTESVPISLPAIHCYAVQIGVYEERSNADAQSDRLRELGAAGYIAEDGGRYRVLAAGYPDESSMEKVRAQLAGSDIDSLPYELSSDGVRLRVEGTAEELSGLEEALSFTAGLPERLSREALRFDKDALAVSDGADAISAVRAECRQYEDIFRSAGLSAEEPLTPVAAYLAGAGELMETLCDMNEAETAAFSSALKRLYLDVVFGYRQMTEQMGAA